MEEWYACTFPQTSGVPQKEVYITIFKNSCLESNQNQTLLGISVGSVVSVPGFHLCGPWFDTIPEALHGLGFSPWVFPLNKNVFMYIKGTQIKYNITKPGKTEKDAKEN